MLTPFSNYRIFIIKSTIEWIDMMDRKLLSGILFVLFYFFFAFIINQLFADNALIRTFLTVIVVALLSTLLAFLFKKTS